MRISENIYKQLLNNCNPVPPESGGILGGKNGIITYLFFDLHSTRYSSYYQPNIDNLNSCISEWNKKGIEFYGIFHTHASNWGSLSIADKEYINQIMLAMPPYINHLYFPLVFPKSSIKSFKVERLSSGIKIVSNPIKIIK